MKRTLIIGLVLTLSLAVAGTAFARWGGGYGMMGGGYGMMDGYGRGYDRTVDVEALKKFQKETLPLRDELVTKRAELAQEYDKSEADTDRIAQLRKDIIDIEAKIQKAADKYEIGGGFGRRGAGRGYYCDGPRYCN